MNVLNSSTSFTLPLVGRAGVGVALKSTIEKEFFSQPNTPSDPHPNPPHEGEGAS